MFDWISDDTDGSDVTPVRHMQAQGDLVVYEGYRVGEAQADGLWVRGDPVEIEQ